MPISSDTQTGPRCTSSSTASGCRSTTATPTEAPAGGASSNVLDMARWMRLLLAEGGWNGRQLIDRDALLEGHTPQILSGHPSTPESRSGFYGFGVNVGYDYPAGCG